VFGSYLSLTQQLGVIVIIFPWPLLPWLAHNNHNNPPLAPVLEGACHPPPSDNTHLQHYEQPARGGGSWVLAA